MRTVTTDSASAEQQSFEELPERVREALGELAGAASEGLMALSVGVGLGVLHELMEAEVEEVVGPRGRHDPDRRAKRHGHEPASVTLGARRVAVSRPRVRSADEEHEVALSTFSHFAARDALSAAVLERMLAGVSTRRFARTQEPVGEAVEDRARSTSKSAVSRAFVARTAETLHALMARRLDDVRLAVLMLDGIELKGRTNVVALGITTEGQKVDSPAPAVLRSSHPSNPSRPIAGPQAAAWGWTASSGEDGASASVNTYFRGLRSFSWIVTCALGSSGSSPGRHRACRSSPERASLQRLPPSVPRPDRLDGVKRPIRRSRQRLHKLRRLRSPLELARMQAVRASGRPPASTRTTGAKNARAGSPPTSASAPASSRRTSGMFHSPRSNPAQRNDAP
jgi:hypothetical protein